MTSTYSLHPDYLIFCKGFWDPEKKQYHTGSSADIVNCCIDSCTRSFAGKVQDKAFEMKKTCISACLALPAPGLESIEDCIPTVGCERYDVPCIVENREKIIECCRKQCTPSQSEECKDCEDMFDLTLLIKRQLTGVPEYSLSALETNNNETKFSWYYFLLLLIPIVIYILYRKLN